MTSEFLKKVAAYADSLKSSPDVADNMIGDDLSAFLTGLDPNAALQNKTEDNNTVDNSSVRMNDSKDSDEIDQFLTKQMPELEERDNSQPASPVAKQAACTYRELLIARFAAKK